MPQLVIRASRTKYALFLILAVGFTAAGVFMIVTAKGSDQAIGWACTLFFGAGIPLFIKQLVDTRARLVIDDAGVFDRTLGIGVIPWQEITGAYLRSIASSDFICLELRNPELFLGKLSPIKRSVMRANESLGFTPINLNLSGVKGDSRDILELVLKMSAAASQSPPSSGLLYGLAEDRP
jgi:hypothetical protein